MKIVVLLALAVYGFGVWKFWTGFKRTNFSQGRLPLALLWPILVIANKSYRQNFNKVLKGQ
ncbi:hypothetical protein OsccyDRAFT_1580 [Leptolyngbyaceae cyanobacterium JSC-12]|nr:hypothetical protein OsccyDRAFT_1580 [Leptolyngbyaceae cyanobacterium JSC-12]